MRQQPAQTETPRSVMLSELLQERFDILLFAAGLFCIGMTLWILISEISEYAQQKDWTAATAVVVDVSPHSGDYDVYYQYEATGDIYTGKFSKVGKRALGETIEIRYNTDAPEKSNWVLEMGIKTILKDVFMIAIFWTLGARLIECALPKKKRREEQDDGRAARRAPRQRAPSTLRRSGGRRAARCASRYGRCGRSIRIPAMRCGWSAPRRWSRRAVRRPGIPRGSSSP